MSLNLSEIANNTTVGLSVILIILALVNLYLVSRNRSSFAVFSVYVIFCCLFDLSGWILSFYDYSNIRVLPLFNIIELFLFSYYFRNKLHVLFPYLIFMIGLLVNLYEFLRPYESYSVYMNWGRIFNALMIIGQVFFGLFTNSKPGPEIRLNYLMLYYFSITFVHFLMLNLFINAVTELKFIFWMLYAVSCGVFYIYITRFLWKYGKTVPS